MNGPGVIGLGMGPPRPRFGAAGAPLGNEEVGVGTDCEGVDDWYSWEAAWAAACARAVVLIVTVVSSRRAVGRFPARVPRQPVVGCAGSERCSACKIAGGGMRDLSGCSYVRGRIDSRRARDLVTSRAGRGQSQPKSNKIIQNHPLTSLLF